MKNKPQANYFNFPNWYTLLWLRKNQKKSSSYFFPCQKICRSHFEGCCCKQQSKMLYRHANKKKYLKTPLPLTPSSSLCPPLAMHRFTASLSLCLVTIFMTFRVTHAEERQRRQGEGRQEDRQMTDPIQYDTVL